MWMDDGRDRGDEKIEERKNRYGVTNLGLWVNADSKGNHTDLNLRLNSAIVY